MPEEINERPSKWTFWWVYDKTMLVVKGLQVEQGLCFWNAGNEDVIQIDERKWRSRRTVN